MSETTTSIDLKNIFNKILNGWKIILAVCVLALLAGGIFFAVSEKKFKHKTTVLLRNPLESERFQTFAQSDVYYQNIRNFADEDHIDEVMAFTKTTDFIWAVSSQFNLKDKYGDGADKYIQKNLLVTRSSNRDIEFSFISNDKELGAQVVNFARDYVEAQYANYFKAINSKRIEQLTFQSQEINNQIHKLSDSILSIKAQYQLAGQMLPSRGESNSTTSAAGIDMNKAKGLELLQTYTAQKDKLVQDLASNQSLINQFNVTLQDEHRTKYFHVIEEGGPDKFNSYPNVVFLFLSIFLSAFFVGVIIALLKK